MRNFHSGGLFKDKKFIIAFAIALICAIICGIVLYKTVIFNEYFFNFASDYVFYVFNFENATLLISKLITDVIYFYIVFAISYFTNLKYLSLIPVFLRGVFFGVYTAILISANAFSGTIVAIFVFIPASLISFAICFLIAASCKIIYKKSNNIVMLFFFSTFTLSYIFPT